MQYNCSYRADLAVDLSSGLVHERGSAKLALGADRLDAGKACTYTTCICLDLFLRWLDAYVHEELIDSYGGWILTYMKTRCILAG